MTNEYRNQIQVLHLRFDNHGEMQRLYRRKQYVHPCVGERFGS